MSNCTMESFKATATQNLAPLQALTKLLKFYLNVVWPWLRSRLIKVVVCSLQQSLQKRHFVDWYLKMFGNAEQDARVSQVMIVSIKVRNCLALLSLLARLRGQKNKEQTSLALPRLCFQLVSTRRSTVLNFPPSVRLSCLNQLKTRPLCDSTLRVGLYTCPQILGSD